MYTLIAADLQPAELYSVGDRRTDGWMDVIKLSSNHYSYSFCPILTKVGTYHPCANKYRKNVGQIVNIVL